MPQIHPPTASVKKAAELVGLSTWEVKELCDSGVVDSHLVRRVNVDSLLAFVAATNGDWA